ncbi:hypothetical protein DR76_4934 (plasmid) [Escherichia coli ATCC 25922]|nr:hypothetical protein DR76_4934 [Escherichia coli ATCC 25922]
MLSHKFSCPIPPEKTQISRSAPPLIERLLNVTGNQDYWFPM